MTVPHPRQSGPPAYFRSARHLQAPQKTGASNPADPLQAVRRPFRPATLFSLGAEGSLTRQGSLTRSRRWPRPPGPEVRLEEF